MLSQTTTLNQYCTNVQSNYTTKAGVYPFERNAIKSVFQDFDIHSWGVGIRDETVHSKPTEPPHDTRRIREMSISTKKRIIKYTSMLEFFEIKPTHMLTLTLPPQRFEALPDEEKVHVWMRAKRYFLKALQIKLSRYEHAGYMWFLEFQSEKRGAPHLHILLELYEMDDKEWAGWLEWFAVEWAKALKWDVEAEGEYPKQGVDFKHMNHKDFRYARKYITKGEQKVAPFEANWGRWWGVGGSMRLKVSKQYDIKLTENELHGLNSIAGNYRWLTWSKIESLDSNLYQSIMHRIQYEKWIHDDTIKSKKYKRLYTHQELETFDENYQFEFEMNEEILE